MSTSPAPSPPTTAVFEVGAPDPVGDAHPPAPEGCPLCGAPLDPEQEWCLSCGAAARTRLAMSSNWKGPIIAVAIVAALALAVLAVSLVKLAGNSGGTATSVTVTRAAPVTPAATAPAPSATPTPAPTTTTPPTSTTHVRAGAPVAPAVKPTHTGSHLTDTTRARLRLVEKEEAKAETPAAKKADHAFAERLRERLQRGE